MRRYNLVVVNSGEPTFQRAAGGGSVLDLAIVCCHLAGKTNHYVINSTMGSDHSACLLVLNEKPNVDCNKPSKFIFSKADWSKFTDICRINFKSIDINRDIDMVTSDLEKAFLKPLTFQYLKPALKLTISIALYHTGLRSAQN